VKKPLLLDRVENEGTGLNLMPQRNSKEYGQTSNSKSRSPQVHKREQLAMLNCCLKPRCLVHGERADLILLVFRQLSETPTFLFRKMAAASLVGYVKPRTSRNRTIGPTYDPTTADISALNRLTLIL
jgi:hypothetical protein